MTPTIESLQAENEALKQRMTDLEETLARERQQSRQELRTTQELFQGVLDSTTAVIYVKDREGRYLLVNQRYLWFTGLSREDVIGKTDTDIFVPDIANAVQANDQQIIATGEVLELEEVVPHQDGLHTYISIKFPLCDEQGNIYAVGGISTDISDRKKAEEQLRRYAAIVEATPDAIAAADANQEIILTNAAYRKLLGVSDTQEAASIKIPETHPDWALRLVQEEGIPTAIRNGVWIGETAMINVQTGEEMPVSQVILAHKFEDGQLDFLSTILHDMTAIKQAEAERMALQQEIIDAQQSTLRELSSPLIPISDNVVLMPLIGSIDSRRAQQVMETLLDGIANHQTDTAILDITGVSVVDTQVANAIIQAAQAVKLLGAQVILTGIGPTMAQTLVHLGADLSTIQTRASLQSAIAYALNEG